MKFIPGCVLKNTGVMGHHFVVVIKNADGQILLTNWTTVHNYKKCDPACILHVGDHPDIKHDSYMNYKDSIVKTDNELEELIKDKNFVRVLDLREDILKKIIQGASVSKRISHNLKDLFEL